MNDTSFNKNMISSIITAIGTKTIVSPITRIKVLQQIQTFHSSNHYSNPLSSIKYIYRNEGVKGFYKGNFLNITKSVPNYMLKFPLNDIYINTILQNSEYKTVKELPFNELLKAGFFTGIVQTSCAYPLDLIRTRLIQDANMNNQQLSIINSIVKFIKSEGITSLYKGFTPAILTTPLYIGLQLSSYQYIKNQDSFISNSFIAGGMAGIISQSIMYPGDTIKRHMQINGMNNKTKYKTVRGCIKELYKTHGIGGFYKGILLNSIKSVPEIAIKFTIYDYIKQTLN